MDSRYLEISFLLLLAGGGMYLFSTGLLRSGREGDEQWIQMERPRSDNGEAQEAPPADVAALTAMKVSPAPDVRAGDEKKAPPRVPDGESAGGGDRGGGGEADLDPPAGTGAAEGRPAEGAGGPTLLEEANRYLREHQLDEAEKIYRRMLEMDDSPAAAYIGLGEIYMEKGNFSTATEMFNHATSSIRKGKSP